MKRWAVETVCGDQATWLVVADVDFREDHRGSAPITFTLPGSGQVEVPEALGPLPREVGVGEQHHAFPFWESSGPTASALEPIRGKLLLGLVLGVRGRWEFTERVGGLRQAKASSGAMPPRRRRVDDVGDEVLGARDEIGLVDPPPDVDRLDRLDPFLAAAARIGDAVDPDLLQVRVVAGGVAADRRFGVLRRGSGAPFAFSRSSIRPESITDCQKKSESRLLTGPAALAGLSPRGRRTSSGVRRS